MKYIEINFVQDGQKLGVKKCSSQEDFANSDRITKRYARSAWNLYCPQRYEKAKIANGEDSKFSLQIDWCKGKNKGCANEYDIIDWLENKIFVTNIITQKVDFDSQKEGVYSFPFETTTQSFTLDTIRTKRTNVRLR